MAVTETGLLVEHAPAYVAGAATTTDLASGRLGMVATCAALAVALGGCTSRGREIHSFEGTWRNLDEATEIVTALEISIESVNVRVQAWGQCEPSDCDWGEVLADAYTQNGLSPTDSVELLVAKFETPLSQVLMIMRLVRENRMNVHILTRYTDDRRLRNHTSEHVFERQRSS